MRHFALLWLVTGFLAPSAVAAAEEPVDYLGDIKPLLARRCVSCHGALKQKGELRLDTAGLLKKGGAGGEAIQPGKPEESLLLDAVLGQNGVTRMPLEGEPLKEAEIDLLRRWIAEGAKAPNEPVPGDPRSHWAFQLPVRPAVPAAGDTAHPIDAFLAREQVRLGLTPRPLADKQTLLRRVYLDLTGLPPTRAEMTAFLADESPEAYERVVDQLLASPRYGERWGRHWMDVWRYSDWDGYGAEVRESQPHIWRWRDWIVESLNADKPYDQMVVEMLAADEATPEDADALRATGFLVRNWFKFNRHVWLDNTVEHTGKAFLGVTLNCARCHDHMYDPLSQEEYYKFRAIFEPYDVRTDRLPGQADVAQDGLVRAYDAQLATPTFLFHRGDDKQPDKEHPLPAGVPVSLGGEPFAPATVALGPTARYPGAAAFIQAEETAAAEKAVLTAQQAVKTAAEAAAEVKKSYEAQAANSEKPLVPEPFLADEFDAAQPELWKTGEGEWVYADGKLIQKQVASRFSALRTVKPHPVDFHATLRFRTTGGTTYRSVGLCFDALEETDFHGVYLSISSQPSLRIFQRKAGQDIYPATGIQNVAAELNREYEMTVLVRGTLVNVLLDGQRVLAYKLPDARREGGQFSIWTYDASAEFISVSVLPLANDIKLLEQLPKPGEPAVPLRLTLADLKTAADRAEADRLLAEKNLAVATAMQQSVMARIAADLAKFASPPAADAAALAAAASRAEKDLAVVQAEAKLLAAEQNLARLQAAPQEGQTPAAIMAAETAKTQAAQALETARTTAATPGETYAPFGPVYPAESSGRRLALARWIASRQNPLTARVAVNHLWLRHYGEPLVPTVFDFGLNGKPPTHPELLDWLAVELMDNGWKMKPLHRLLVTSLAYRRDSSLLENDPNSGVDPENRYLWRMNRRRLEAEVVRDAELQVAGQLDLTMGGPDLDPNLGLTVYRRSLYFRTAKEKKMTFLALFDGPNVVECYRRSESIVPQQALAMANSPLTQAVARTLAAKLTAEAGTDDPAFIQAAYEDILGRPASAAELEACRRFLGTQAAKFQQTGLTPFTSGTAANVAPSTDPAQRARENLVHVLFNHHDFVTIR